MVFRSVHIQIHGAYEYVTSLDKRDLACVIKLEALEMGDDPGGPHGLTRESQRLKREAGGLDSEREM